MPAKQSRHCCKRDIPIIRDTCSLMVYNCSVHPTSLEGGPTPFWKDSLRLYGPQIWVIINSLQFWFIDWLWIICVDISQYSHGRISEKPTGDHLECTLNRHLVPIGAHWAAQVTAFFRWPWWVLLRARPPYFKSMVQSLYELFQTLRLDVLRGYRYIS